MHEVFKKLSSYNIFNYLLPGIIFVVLVQNFTGYNFIQKDIIIGAFLYYFIGLGISLVGSLVIEPFLKFIKFLKFAEYKDFVIASKNDSKIEILSEQNNMYRTFVSMIVSCGLLKAYELIRASLNFAVVWDKYVLIMGFLLLFASAYRKQTNYIYKRIKIEKK